MLSPPQEDRELIADLKEGLFLMTEAYKAVLGTSDEEMLEELLLKYINKSDSTACCVALRYFTYYVVLGSIQIARPVREQLFANSCYYQTSSNISTINSFLLVA